MTMTKLKKIFNRYNPKLTIINARKAVFSCYVCAVYNVSNGEREMDSLYRYNIITNRVCHFNPIEHPILFQLGIAFAKPIK